MKPIYKVLLMLLACVIGYSTAWYFLVQDHFAVNSMNEVTAQEEVSIGNVNTKKNISYVVMEKAHNHMEVLNNLMIGMKGKGMIECEALPLITDEETDISRLWEFLQEDVTSNELNFLDGYVAYEKSDAYKKEVIAQIKKDIKTKHIDLLVVMGKEAAVALKNENLDTKLYILDVDNPVAYGIVKSDTFSGVSNRWAHTNIDNYKNQVRVFYDQFKFQKLGVVYDDSPENNQTWIIQQLKEVAEERGFKLVTSTLKDSKDNFAARAKKVYSELAEKTDAVYLLRYENRDKAMISELMTPFYEYQKPVFSALSVNVKYGMLMSVVETQSDDTGFFYATRLREVLEADSLEHIPQAYKSTPQIILNMAVAEKIGYKVNLELLLVADKVYLEITKP